MITELHTYLKRAEEEFEKFYTQEVVNKGKGSFLFGKTRSSISKFFIFLLFLSAVIIGFNLLEKQGGTPSRILFNIQWFLMLSFIIACFFIFRREKQPSNDFFSRLAVAQGNIYKGRIQRDAFPQGITTAIQKGFIPNFSVRHGFWTEQDGLALDLWKANWEVDNDDSVTYYQGVVVSCHLRTALKGTTILVSDSLSAKFTGKLGGFSRVKLEWIEFEEAFDLFSTDEHEARIIMAPDTMEALYDFYKQMENRSVCFVFEGDTLSCFYSLGEEGNLWEKRKIKKLFCNLYLLKYFPQLIRYKMLVSAWQEENYLQEHKEEHKSACVRQDPSNIPDAQGITPLMKSILDNNFSSFKQLLSTPHADANQAFAPNGNTLLHLAVINNRLEMVQHLLTLPHVETQATNKEGQTPLDIARARGYEEIIQLLQSHCC